METDIIGQIAQAEKEAAERKAQAVTRAAEIVAEAEKRAAELIKKSEAELAAFREAALKEAEERAQKEYDKSISDCAVQEKKYADELIKGAENHITQIVGRLTK